LYFGAWDAFLRELYETVGDINRSNLVS
jgi:hypothetical protein